MKPWRKQRAITAPKTLSDPRPREETGEASRVDPSRAQTTCKNHSATTTRGRRHEAVRANPWHDGRPPRSASIVRARESEAKDSAATRSSPNPRITRAASPRCGHHARPTETAPDRPQPSTSISAALCRHARTLLPRKGRTSSRGSCRRRSSSDAAGSSASGNHSRVPLPRATKPMPGRQSGDGAARQTMSSSICSTSSPAWCNMSALRAAPVLVAPRIVIAQRVPHER